MEDIENIPQLVFERKLLTEEGWLVLEHSREKDFKDMTGFFDQRKYGGVNFSFFK